MSFEQSFEYLLKWEGGFGNDPRDPGGATNLGVIQTEYDAYRTKKGLLVQSVRYITKAEAGEIYKTKYWDVVGCDSLNPGVANATFDAAVNSGTGRGARWLQQAINQLSGHEAVKVDESCGPVTIAAANALPADTLIDAMLTLRLAFMKVAKNPKTGAALWPVFGSGWSSRITGVRAQSHALAGLPASTQPLPTQGASTMATTSPTVNSNPVVAAAVKAATTPIKSIWSSITGLISSIGGGAVATVITAVAPNLTAEIAGGLGIAFAVVNAAAHIYTLVTGQIANNNATIALAENLLNEAEAVFGGGKTFTFDNGPTPAAS
jgi:lysozyme family protein